MSYMHRHRKDSNYHLFPRKYPNVVVNQELSENAIYINQSSTLTNVSTSSDAFFNQNVYDFANGNVLLGTHTLGKTFAFSTWIKVTSQNSFILLNAEDFFQIILNTSTDTLVIKRLVYGNQYEEIIIPCIVPLDEWVLISLIRDFETLKIVKGLDVLQTITDYFYDIPQKNIYIGKNLTAKLYNPVIYLKKYKFPGIYTDLTPFKQPLNLLTNTTENAELKIIDLQHEEIVSCSNLFPVKSGNTTYRPFEDYWDITRATTTASFRSSVNGLVILPPSNIKLTYPYTIDIGFSIPNTTSNIVLASQWYSATNRSWYLWYDLDNNDIKFVYLNKVNNTVNQVSLGTYISGQINYVSFTVDKDELKLFFNGVLKTTIAISLVKLHRFHFNYDINLVTSTGSKFYLHKFTVSKGKKYVGSHLPYLSSLNYKYVPTKISIYDYHYKEDILANKRKAPLNFEILGDASIAPNSVKTYTVVLQGKRRHPTTVKLSIKLPDKTDLVETDITMVNEVVVPVDNLTATFTVAIGNYAVNPYKNKFSIVGESDNRFFVKEIDIVDTRVIDLSYISGLTGFLDGYLSRDSSVSGTIPNILQTRQATTVATLENTLHGQGYLVQNTSSSIQFQSQDTVRTAILIYRELNPVINRGYFGNSDTYTFNGGSTQQLIGNLVFNAGEYIKALSLMKKISKVKIAENDSMFVMIDESAYKVFIYEKTLTGWSSTGIELDLGFGDNTVIVNASIDINSNGTVVALGFQNANNGEGVVQVWRLVAGIWTKDLHLGSPIPAPYTGAFGHAVAIDDTGTKLFVSQIDNNTVYFFEKNTLWSATPVNAITGTNRFGYQLSCNALGNKLFINEVDTGTSYIYELGSIWSLTQTINFGIDGKLNKAGNFLVLSNFNTNTVKLYDYSTSFTLIKTITGASNFGYSVGLNNAKDVLIGSPSEHKVYHYLASSNYTTPIEYLSINTSTNDFYGYTSSLSNSSLVISNFYDNLELITNDTVSVPSTILAVRQNYANADKSDILNTKEPQVLTFYTTLPLTISNIGNTKSSLSLNGLVYGWFLFNRLLTSTEIETIELLLKKILALNTYSLYET